MLLSSGSIEEVDKSTTVFPFKIRQLLGEGFAAEYSSNRSSEISDVLPPNLVSEASCEATNKDAFLDRVESYSCLKWTGKPCVLSPLMCAKYGWINVECDILKCSSCQAFLCASIRPSLDFQKYEQRILELSQQLKTQHEKFCSWPDFPCPERFWMVPVNEPDEVLNAFLERFKSACVLQHQLPTIKPEQLKTMDLSEDVLSSLLELVEHELMLDDSPYPLNVQAAACVVALGGWAARCPRPYADILPILTCTYCMRKAGMWNFYQLDGVSCEGDNSSQYHSSPPIHEGRSGDKLVPSSPPQSPSPCRMKLRSQDAIRTEQSEITSFPLVVRTRSRDSPSPSEDIPRNKRPLTRSRGHGDTLIGEMPSSPQKKTKRPHLFCVSDPEGFFHRSLFDPVAQHRIWCPWVNVGSDDWNLDSLKAVSCETVVPEVGWRATLRILLKMKRSSSPVEPTLSKLQSTRKLQAECESVRESILLLPGNLLIGLKCLEST